MAFSVSLPKLQAYIDQAWVDPIQKSDLIAEVGAVRAQLSNQTARIQPITGTGRNAKKITTTIYWQDFCSITPEACSDECTATTATSDDSEQDVTISGCRQVEFAKSMKQFRTVPHNWDQTIAMELAANMKALDEWLNTTYIAFVEANKGSHEYDLPVGTNYAEDWTIPAESWDVDLIPELRLAARFAKFGRPYILDGTNLWSKVYKAGFYNANADGKGENALFNDFPYVFDPLAMADAAPNKTYLINASAIALLTGNYWGDAREEMAPGHFVYRVQSRNLPGVFYDVHEIQACASNDFVTSWQIRVNYEFVLNPKGCTTTRTGILAFEKGAGA